MSSGCDIDCVLAARTVEFIELPQQSNLYLIYFHESLTKSFSHRRLLLGRFLVQSAVCLIDILFSLNVLIIIILSIIFSAIFTFV